MGADVVEGNGKKIARLSSANLAHIRVMAIALFEQKLKAAAGH
jgi:hypothetical protein